MEAPTPEDELSRLQKQKLEAEINKLNKEAEKAAAETADLKRSWPHGREWIRIGAAVLVAGGLVLAYIGNFLAPMYKADQIEMRLANAMTQDSLHQAKKDFVREVAALTAAIARKDSLNEAGRARLLSINTALQLENQRGESENSVFRDSIAALLHAGGTNIPIELKAGWNLLTYPKSVEMPVADALEPILPYVLTLQSPDGSSFIPIAGIDGVGTMKPAKAYRIKVDRDVSFSYP